MLKKIENWLRRIFADEVGKVETNLKNYYFAHIKQVLDDLIVNRVLIRDEMREIITEDLKQFRADLVAERLLVAGPQHWKADAGEVKQQRELIHPKPTRR